MRVGIRAIDHAVPASVQTAEQLAPLIGKSAEWISENAGVSCRHISQVNEDPAQLVATIAQPMIEQWGQPDLLIHAAAMTRQMLPEMSVFIGRELGLAGVPSFTINASCLRLSSHCKPLPL